MQETITSTHNPKIRTIIGLQKPKERKAAGVFVIEGIRELKQAINAGFQIDEIYYCREIIGDKLSEFPVSEQTRYIEISKRIFEHIAYRESTEGFIAVSKTRELSLDDVVLPTNPLVLIIEGIEKPGNLGAILRTADAANVDLIVICNGITDLYNPNVIRSSLGCIFTRQIAMQDTITTIKWLKEKKINIIVTSLLATESYHQVNYNEPTSIVMGSESAGISDQWLEAATHKIIIPMLGKVDSMNVSVSAGIVIYEALRQRDFKQVF